MRQSYLVVGQVYRKVESDCGWDGDTGTVFRVERRGIEYPWFPVVYGSVLYSPAGIRDRRTFICSDADEYEAVTDEEAMVYTMAQEVANV